MSNTALNQSHYMPRILQTAGSSISRSPRSFIRQIKKAWTKVKHKIKHILGRKTEELKMGSQVYWARSPDGTALIFVHGFNGHSTNTWRQFPNLLLREEKCTNSDLIFYEYDSLFNRSRNSALDLREFLNKLFTAPLSIINTSLQPDEARPEEFAYRKIFLIAHSLGAIVSRQALLEAWRNNDDWARKVGLLLFAPAHRGASILALAQEGLFWIVPLSALVKYKYQSLLDVDSDSQTIQDLLEETREALKDKKNSYLTALTVVLADHDKIVNPNQFLNDPLPVKIPGKGHSEVCKPNPTFTQPFDEVVKVL